MDGTTEADATLKEWIAYATAMRELLQDIRRCCTLKMHPHFSFGPERYYRDIDRLIADDAVHHDWQSDEARRQRLFVIQAALTRRMVISHKPSTDAEVVAQIEAYCDRAQNKTGA